MITAARRPKYHQTILKRVDKELTKRIYKEQTLNPTPGDFVKLLEEDFKIIEEKQNNIQIRNMKCTVYKKICEKENKGGCIQVSAGYSKETLKSLPH